MERADGYAGHVVQCYETDAEACGCYFGFGLREDVATSSTSLRAFRTQLVRYGPEVGSEVSMYVREVVSLKSRACALPSFRT